MKTKWITFCLLVFYNLEELDIMEDIICWTIFEKH